VGKSALGGGISTQLRRADWPDPAPDLPLWLPSGGADQGEDAVGNLRGQRDQGRGADHAVGGHDRVEDALQVGVGAGHHPAEHVARSGDGVHLEHLRDRGQPFGHRVVAAGLADLDRDERGDL
jgi:hypothetical protein